MELLLSEDWRKQAGAQPDSSVQPAEEVEKAFLDQAYMHIQNKATPLMKQQFRVGFEIVHKNDENTRMVGVFVFRVGEQFFYAPVFFLNGAIKGTDLLYRANVKRFIPLNNEWCEYLINLSTMDEGHGVSIRERQLTRDQLNLLDVVEPPQMFRYRRKYASADERTRVLAEIDLMLKQAVQIPGQPTSSLLRKFITEYGGFNAIKKIANTAKHEPTFARALLTGSHPDNYMPQLPADAPGKKVAATRNPLLVLHTSVLRNPNVKKASVQEMCAGYKLEDFRKEGEANDVVYTDNQADVHSIEAPGVYSVLMADGSSRKMMVAFYGRMDVASSACAPKAYTSSYDPPHNRRRSVCLIDVESGKSDDVNMDVNRQEWVFGTYEGSLNDSDKLKKLEDAATGKAYRIYDTKAESFSEPFYVVSKEKSEGGLDALKVTSWDPTVTEGTILINPEYADYDPEDNIFGSRCKVIEVEHTTVEHSGNKRVEFGRPEGLGNKNTLNAFIFEHNFKRGSVQVQDVKGDLQFLVRTARTDNKWTNGLSKLSAKIRLMTDCFFREDTAEEVIKLATDGPKKSYNFLYEGTDKLAHNVRFNDWPEFYERQNSEFNVLEQPRTNWIMESEFDRPIHQPHRVGDVWSQDSSESLDTMTPMQLYDISKQRGIGNMFEHGIVGELVKTYDSNQLIQSYVADLELALDRIGRIIFLFYWKPEDFSASYGSDDQTALENKFLSNFKSLGEMTLELLQKAKLQQEGTPSLT